MLSLPLHFLAHAQSHIQPLKPCWYLSQAETNIKEQENKFLSIFTAALKAGPRCALRGKLNTVTVDGDFRVRFCYTFTSGEPVAFAFCYPFSYSDQQQLLDSLDTLYKSSASPNRGSSPSSSSSIHQGHLSSIPSPSSALKDSTPINSDRLAEPGEEPCLGGSTGRQSHSQTPGKMGGRGLGLAGVASSRSPLERLNTQQAPRRSASRDLPASCGLVPSLEATALGSEEVSAGPALFDDRDWDPVEPSQIFYSRQVPSWHVAAPYGLLGMFLWMLLWNK